MSRKQIFIIHLLFWIYVFYPDFIVFVLIKEYKFEFPDQLFSYLIFFSVFYLFYLVVFPRLRQIKNKVYTVLIGLGAVFIIGIFRIIIWYFLDTYVSHKTLTFPFYTSWELVNEFRSTLVLGIYTVLMRLAIDWYVIQKQKAELITQNQASELALLRSQVNPHFLFNTLNNIYSLVYKKAEEAPEAVMKLSSIMRYMLYDATTDKVLLEKEIEYLQSFIELQKLRLRHKDYIELLIEGNADGRYIAPMLLIPFVENAFKHGDKSGTRPGIWIRLTIESSRIVFEVKNRIRKINNASIDKIGGIGLNNIRRRLELLYPQKHSLEIIPEDTMFSIKLILENQ
ncbi:MAG TPA: histidine kinase [Bacteroidales bacterium]|nr:histidine kinase [Bacteroidales bacterium]HPT03715.1 histidine kinase [Bacteroidales bacterium]